jgi:Raf kinase inhibitor-like YbhB/YbcL family protein
MLEKLPESLGHALRSRRAGLQNILFNKLRVSGAIARLELSSPAFADQGRIPALFTADGEGISPPLQWRTVPAMATTLVLIVEDADSPTPEPLVHAIAVDIDPKRDGLAAGELNEEHGAALRLGRNSYLKRSWLPPDPPPGHGVHHYAFQLFALSDGRAFSEAPGRKELAQAIRERTVSSGCLIGIYERTGKVESPH